MQVKDIAASAAKFARNASAAAGEYAVNAQAAGQRWATNTQAAGPTYQQAIAAPGIPARFARGVQKAGAAKYSGQIAKFGQARYSDGVAGAESSWQAGFQPFAAALGSVTLSPRRPRGDRSNYRRTEEVGVKLNATRLAGLGGAS